MLDRQRLTEIAIVAGTSGVGAACVVVAAKLATNHGDVLGFFGGAVGAGMAVIGALWLEDRKRVEQASIGRRLVGEALIMLASASRAVAGHDGRDAVVRFRSVIQNMQNYLSVRDRMTVDNAMHSAAFTTLAYWCERHVRELDDICSAYERGDNEGIARGKELSAKTLESVNVLLKSSELFGGRLSYFSHLSDN